MATEPNAGTGTGAPNVEEADTATPKAETGAKGDKKKSLKLIAISTITRDSGTDKEKAIAARTSFEAGSAKEYDRLVETGSAVPYTKENARLHMAPKFDGDEDE